MKWGGMSTHHLVNVHRSTVFNTLAVVNRNKRLRASETCSQSVLDHNVVWLSHHNTDFSKFANTVSRSFPDGGADGGGEVKLDTCSVHKLENPHDTTISRTSAMSGVGFSIADFGDRGLLCKNKNSGETQERLKTIM